MKRLFSLLAGLLALMTVLPLSPAHAALFQVTFDDASRQLLGGQVIGQGNTVTDSFEMTNNTGQTWNGFEVTVDFANFVDSTYSGPGSASVSGGVSGVLTISGLTVPSGQRLDFSIDTEGRQGSQGYFGTPQVVPIPAALPLMLSGIAGLAWLRRRQTAKAG